MENIALIESFSEFKDDKLIDRVTLMAILEEVFRSALKRKFGEDDNFDIYVDRSHARYLSDWFVKSGEDPITRDLKYRKITAN